MILNGVNIQDNFLKQEATKWGIKEIALFGSILTDKFTPQSDIDLMITFKDDAKISYFDILSLKDEFSQELSRSVDVVEKKAIRNPYMQKTIFSSFRVIYAS